MVYSSKLKTSELIRYCLYWYVLYYLVNVSKTVGIEFEAMTFRRIVTSWIVFSFLAMVVMLVVIYVVWVARSSESLAYYCLLGFLFYNILKASFLDPLQYTDAEWNAIVAAPRAEEKKASDV